MSSALGSPGLKTPNRPTGTRLSSTRSARTYRVGTLGEGYAADADNDDDEEGDFDGEDGDEDDEEMAGSEGVFGGQDMLNETTIKSGYLWKRGEKRKNWKKRWFALRSSKLCYYKNEKEYQLLRFIDIADVHTVAAIALKKNENSFGIVTSKRQYYVRAANAKEMQEWIDGIKDAQEQVRQRSTITREMAGMEVGTSGGEDPLVSSPRQRATSIGQTSTSLERQHSSKVNTNASPINIVIPGKGLYTSPAQARQSSTGASILSPLTATSDSESGTAAGAEQFGLSYASSTGHSMASSPGRSGVIHHQLEQSSGGAVSGGRQSPHSHSGGDEGFESLRRSKTQRSANGLRDASVGSSGGEGSSGMRTGWTAAGGGGSKGQSQANQAQQSTVLSSSDEDGEGEDWDEDEVADRAMPLPGSSGLASTHAGHPPPQSANPTQSAPSNSEGKPKIDSDFFKSSNKVIHQGYLMKQSNRRKHWRKRWFVLTSANLSYTRSHMNEKPNRKIPLTSILDAIEYTSKKVQAPASQLQSPTPSSPGLQSPPLPMSFQLGSTQETTAGHSLPTREATAPASGEHASSGTGDHGIEKKSSLLASPSMSVGPPKRKKENCFKIITPKRTYVVCAPTEEEEIKWLSALQALLAHWRDVKEAEVDTPVASTPRIQPSATATGTPLASTPRPTQRGNATEDVGVPG